MRADLYICCNVDAHLYTQTKQTNIRFGRMSTTLSRCGKQLFGDLYYFQISVTVCYLCDNIAVMFSTKHIICCYSLAKLEQHTATVGASVNAEKEGVLA